MIMEKDGEDYLDEVLRRPKEERNILHEIRRRRRSNLTAHLK